MVVNGRKWWNGGKLWKMVLNGRKCLKMVENCRKMVENGGKCWKNDGKCQKIVENCGKCWKIVENSGMMENGRK